MLMHPNGRFLAAPNSRRAIASLALCGPVALCGALVLGLAGAAQATVVAKESFDSLVEKAELIAVGRVVNVMSVPLVDHKYAYTYVTLADLDIIAGQYAAKEITIRLDGGSLGNGKSIIVAGMPRFFIGERVVVFLRANGRHICPLVGWNQGLLRVQENPGDRRQALFTTGNAPIRGLRDGEFVRDQARRSMPVASAGQPDSGEQPAAPQSQPAEEEQQMDVELLRAAVQHRMARVANPAARAAVVESAAIVSEPSQPRPDAASSKEQN